MTTTATEPPPLPLQSRRRSQPIPPAVHLGRAVLALTGFCAVVLWLFFELPAMALHVMASIHSLVRGVPAEPLVISVSGNHFDYAVSLLSGLGFLGMIRGRRCLWAHRLGAGCLAHWTLCALTSDALRIQGPGLTLEHGQVVGQALGFLIMLALFWRFAFGRASRRFFEGPLGAELS